MIESGLGICAACLPAQYSLVKSQGLQGIVKSVQSAISLHSISSRLSGRSSSIADVKPVPGLSDDRPMQDFSSLELGSLCHEEDMIVDHSVHIIKD